MRARKKHRFLKFFTAVITVTLIMLLALGGASGGFLQADYLEPHNPDYYRGFSDVRMQVIAHGIISPNSHNMQAFLLSLSDEDEDSFFMYCDPAKLLKSDPLMRENLCSSGAFIRYMEVGAQRLGLELAFDLFPEGEYEDVSEQELLEKPIAKITLTEGEFAPSALYSHMFEVNVNRSAYRKDAPDQRIISQLMARKDAAGSGGETAGEGGAQLYEGITLKFFTDPADVREIGSLAVRGKEAEFSAPEVAAEYLEITRRNEYQKNSFRTGFSAEGQGFKGFLKNALQGTMTALPFAFNTRTLEISQLHYAKMHADNTPCYIMVITPENTRAMQVKAGHLYADIMLHSKMYGLAVHPLSQTLSDFEKMDSLRQIMHNNYAPDGGRIQMLSRMGYPTEQYEQSARQDIRALII